MQSWWTQIFERLESARFKFTMIRAAAIAPWFHLCLPYRGCGLESQAHHLHFFQLLLMKLLWEKDENKQKEARIGPYKKFTMMAL